MSDLYLITGVLILVCLPDEIRYIHLSIRPALPSFLFYVLGAAFLSSNPPLRVGYAFLDIVIGGAGN
jgi:hypothetical protein